MNDYIFSMDVRFKHFIRQVIDRFPESVRRRIHWVGKIAGGDESFPSIYSALKYLRAWGFRPRRVVDVGAYRGNWTFMMKKIFPQAQVLMVEAQEGKREQLERTCAQFTPDVTYEIALLGPTDDQPVEFVEMESGSSVFEERSDHQPRKRTSRRTTTLDALLGVSTGWEEVDFMKLDVQGYELEVLKGAPASLSSCEVILLEVSVVPRNQGCPTIEEVFAFMTARGFRMLDFCSQRRRENKMLGQTDLLFINARSAFASELFYDHADWCDHHGVERETDALTRNTWEWTTQR